MKIIEDYNLSKIVLIILLIFSSCSKEENEIYVPDCQQYNVSTLIVKNCLPYSAYVYVNWDCDGEDNQSSYYTRPYEYEMFVTQVCKGQACLMVEVDGERHYDTTYIETEQCGKYRLEVGYNASGRQSLNFVINVEN